MIDAVKQALRSRATRRTPSLPSPPRASPTSNKRDTVTIYGTWSKRPTARCGNEVLGGGDAAKAAPDIHANSHR